MIGHAIQSQTVTIIMSAVLLLRQPEEQDKYEAVLGTAGFSPVSVAVLETHLTNDPRLRTIIQSGPTREGFNGVIITSKRSCEAWAESVKRAEVSDDWATVPFYVVGQGTASALQEASPFTLDIRGQHSGNASTLGPFILSDLRDMPNPRLLYLTGDKNRDTLSNILTKGGVALDYLRAYQTEGSPTFEQKLVSALKAAPDADSWWIVFFAPSSASHAIPSLQKHGLLDSAKIAAIGPTTDQALRSDHNMTVHLVAPKPTPESLMSAIQSHS